MILALQHYNGPANYGLTDQGINSELLNQVDVEGLGVRVGIIDTSERVQV